MAKSQKDALKSILGASARKAKEIGNEAISDIIPVQPKDFLRGLKRPYGYGQLEERFLSHILYDPKFGIGVVNKDVSINRVSFKGESVTLYSRAGSVDKKCDILIPEIVFEEEGIIAKRFGGIMPYTWGMEFSLNTTNENEKRCYYDLTYHDPKDSPNSNHHQTSGSFNTICPARFYSLLKNIEFLMLGTMYSRFTPGAFVGIISKDKECFVRRDYFHKD